MDDVFRALADPTRLLMLEELAESNDQTLYELCARMIMKHGANMSRQALTKHLSILEGSGLVRTRHRGKFKVLTYDDRPIRRASKALSSLVKRGQRS